MSAVALKIEQTPLYDYTRFIEALISPELTMTAARVGRLIAKGFRADWGYCCYSIDEMARWLEVSRRSVLTAIKELKKLKLLTIDQTHNRNRYVPLFGHTKIKKVDNKGCKNLHHREVQKSSPPTIEEKSSDSLRESSSSPLETTNEPIARRQDRRAVASNVLVAEDERVIPKAQNWVEFRNYVLERWRLPKGWDRWAFEKSVMSFEHKVRREGGARWRGLPLATYRLLKWMKRERYHTYIEFRCRGEKEFIDEGSDE